jgi:hypothetical protein
VSVATEATDPVLAAALPLPLLREREPRPDPDEPDESEDDELDEDEPEDDESEDDESGEAEPLDEEPSVLDVLEASCEPLAPATFATVLATPSTAPVTCGAFCSARPLALSSTVRTCGFAAASWTRCRSDS